MYGVVLNIGSVYDNHQVAAGLRGECLPTFLVVVQAPACVMSWSAINTLS